MSWSQLGHVQVWVIFLNNWVSRPWVFALKPVTGFETVSRYVTRVVLVHHQVALRHFECPGDVNLGHDIIWTTI